MMFNGMNGLEILKNWPRYESGELVNLGDDVSRHGEDFEANVIELYRDGSFSLNFWSYSKGEPVRRPAPKVLDADGEEIRVGDEVWDKSSGDRLTVGAIEDGGHTIMCRYADIEGSAIPTHGSWSPCDLTHCAPVLASDGKPLRDGETVYHVNTGSEYSVRSVTNGGAHLSKGDKPGGYCRADYLTHQRPVLDADGVPIHEGDTVYLLPGDWCDKFPLLRCHEWDAMKVLSLSPNHDTGRIECETLSSSVVCYPYPSQLTHERPESWERLEKDAKAAVCVYFGVSDRDCGSCGHSSWECSYDKARDLVRRCRALAERERGE